MTVKDTKHSGMKVERVVKPNMWVVLSYGDPSYVGNYEAREVTKATHKFIWLETGMTGLFGQNKHQRIRATSAIAVAPTRQQANDVIDGLRLADRVYGQSLVDIDKVRRDAHDAVKLPYLIANQWGV